MKKYILILICLILNSYSFAQTINKKPLLQLFTSSTCPPCVHGNEVVDSILALNPDEYSLIKYQVDWPGSGDIYYTQEVGSRVNYYGVNGVPSLIVNSESSDPHTFSQEIFDQYSSLLSDVEIEATAGILSSGVITVNTTITPLADYNYDLILHIVIVEKSTFGNHGDNGETEFHNVMLKMLPDANGTTLTQLTQNNSITITESYNMYSTFMEEPDDLAVIVFIQNNENKEIIQSEMIDVTSENIPFYSLTFSIKDQNGNPINNAIVEMEAQAIQTSTPDGKVIFPKVFQRTYTYKASILEHEYVIDSVTILNANIEKDIVINHVSENLIVEHFDSDDIPEGWTTEIEGDLGDIYCIGGFVSLSSWNAEEKVMLISPKINLAKADKLLIETGNHTAYPDGLLIVGTVPDNNNLQNINILDTIISPYEGYEWFEIDISDYQGTDSCIVFSFVSWFGWLEIDDVVISAKPEITDIAGNKNDVFSVFPNPTSDIISLTIPEIEDCQCYNSVKVYDMQGKLVISENKYVNEINVSELNSGLYVIIVEAKNQIYTTKFIKE